MKFTTVAVSLISAANAPRSTAQVKRLRTNNSLSKEARVEPRLEWGRFFYKLKTLQERPPNTMQDRTTRSRHNTKKFAKTDQFVTENSVLPLHGIIYGENDNERSKNHLSSHHERPINELQDRRAHSRHDTKKVAEVAQFLPANNVLPLRGMSDDSNILKSDRIKSPPALSKMLPGNNVLPKQTHNGDQNDFLTADMDEDAFETEFNTTSSVEPCPDNTGCAQCYVCLYHISGFPLCEPDPACSLPPSPTVANDDYSYDDAFSLSYDFSLPPLVPPNTHAPSPSPAADDDYLHDDGFSMNYDFSLPPLVPSNTHAPSPSPAADDDYLHDDGFSLSYDFSLPPLVPSNTHAPSPSPAADDEYLHDDGFSLSYDFSLPPLVPSKMPVTSSPVSSNPPDLAEECQDDTGCAECYKCLYHLDGLTFCGPDPACEVNSDDGFSYDYSMSPSPTVASPVPSSEMPVASSGSSSPVTSSPASSALPDNAEECQDDTGCAECYKCLYHLDGLTFCGPDPACEVGSDDGFSYVYSMSPSPTVASNDDYSYDDEFSMSYHFTPSPVPPSEIPAASKSSSSPTSSPVYQVCHDHSGCAECYRCLYILEGLTYCGPDPACENDDFSPSAPESSTLAPARNANSTAAPALAPVEPSHPSNPTTDYPTSIPVPPSSSTGGPVSTSSPVAPSSSTSVPSSVSNAPISAGPVSTVGSDSPVSSPSSSMPIANVTSSPVGMPVRSPVSASPVAAFPTEMPAANSASLGPSSSTSSPVAPSSITSAPVSVSSMPIASSASASPVSASPTAGSATSSMSAAPTTSEPVTNAPVSAAPTSAAPVSTSPINAPVSAAPTSAAPVSATPSAAPVSTAPTNAPVSAAPTSAAPVSTAPTNAPVSAAPTSAAPVSTSPTNAPVSAAPTSAAPVSATPSAAPVSTAPTNAPVSAAPTSAAPVSATPSAAPATAPTNAPVSAAPVTATPSAAPVSTAPTNPPVCGSGCPSGYTGSLPLMNCQGKHLYCHYVLRLLPFVLTDYSPYPKDTMTVTRVLKCKHLTVQLVLCIQKIQSSVTGKIKLHLVLVLMVLLLLPRPRWHVVLAALVASPEIVQRLVVMDSILASMEFKLLVLFAQRELSTILL
jgi:hypothetical protein